ncbi:MAG: DUF86 domain-containing protein [Desulfobacterales bacterium]|nr:DUF86 domain-containing protein [Desulfobacterales bacterium]
MHDDLIMDNLHDIIDSIQLIEVRFSQITNSDDFVMSADGLQILDSICMRLQIIGELLKKIHKIDPAVLEVYPQIQWANIMKLRDIISHHYDHVDYEIIYDICKNHIPLLKRTVGQILKGQANL